MSNHDSGQTYYELLEVPPTAGPSDIYNAYQRARSTYSANSPAIYSMFTPEEAAQLMTLVEEAYQTLSHQARRKEYDIKIGLAKAPPPRPAQPEPTRSRSQDQWIGPVKVSVGKQEALPSGFARTKFSVYEIKPELEAEIERAEEVDGLFIQKVRLYKGVTLDQMSDEIRVIKSTLVALEANDLEALPVAVFTRGFVVQMARLLGLNERRVSDAYMKYFRSKRP